MNPILVISGFWPTRENPVTGIFVVQQAAALARGQRRVVVLVPRTMKSRSQLLGTAELGMAEYPVEIIETPCLKLPNVFLRIPGVLSLNAFLWGRCIARGIAKLQEPFGGCLVHGLQYAGLSIPYWSRSITTGIAVVVHGRDPALLNAAKRWEVKRLVRAMEARVESVILVGTSLTSYATSLGLDARNVSIVPNGTEVPRLSEVSTKQRTRLETRIVVSVSNLIQVKGIDLNLMALAALSSRRPDLNWHYQIIGDGTEAGRLKDLARRLGISDRVSFLGRIGYSETMRRIDGGDVFSLPSWGEAFGIVYLEAMARGRPVVGCQRNGAADIVTDGVDGILVPPRDVAALTAALEILLDSPERCRELGSRARDTAERFSWERNVDRLTRLLASGRRCAT
jgi:glycosyltransferase involved in cell wall biosynthesis